MERTEMATIIYEKEGGVARIVLNMPEKANIQTAQQVWDFEDALKWANRDDEVKVLIVKANGKGFCAGHAIVEPEEMADVYPTTGPTSGSSTLPITSSPRSARRGRKRHATPELNISRSRSTTSAFQPRLIVG